MPMNFDLKNYINPVFIETGTWYGEGVKTAFNTGFNEIYSIEYSSNVLANTSKILSNELTTGKIKLYCGDSKKVLPQILEKVNGRACTFWLDAHYQVDANFKGGDINDRYPLYRELDLIKEFGLSNSTILIDDRRLFTEWGLSLATVISKLEAINPKFSIGYENGIIVDDVLVATVKKGWSYE